MSDEGHRRDGNVPGGLSCEGTSGTSSAKTTAKPLYQRIDKYDRKDT